MECKKYSIAQNYAKALFDMALQIDQIELIQENLSLFALEVCQNECVKHFFALPIFSLRNKLQIVKAILDKSKLNNLSTRFILTLINNNRVSLLKQILTEFDQIKLCHLKVCNVTVLTTNAINEHEKPILTKLLADKIQRVIKLNIETDSTLLGGLVIKFDDYIIDASLKNAINRVFSV